MYKYLYKLYFTYDSNKLIINNYKKILKLENTNIKLLELNIKGDDLTICKMDKKEIEVKGNINIIEVIKNV